MNTSAVWTHKTFAATAAILLACCTLAYLQTREQTPAKIYYHNPAEAPAAAAAEAGMSGASFLRPRFLLFGDSLTERSLSGERGWGASLAHTFFRKVSDDGFGRCKICTFISLIADRLTLTRIIPIPTRPLEMAILYWGGGGYQALAAAHPLHATPLLTCQSHRCCGFNLPVAPLLRWT
jgi:hypothetical protein